MNSNINNNYQDNDKPDGMSTTVNVNRHVTERTTGVAISTESGSGSQRTTGSSSSSDQPTQNATSSSPEDSDQSSEEVGQSSQHVAQSSEHIAEYPSSSHQQSQQQPPQQQQPQQQQQQPQQQNSTGNVPILPLSLQRPQNLTLAGEAASIRPLPRGGGIEAFNVVQSPLFLLHQPLLAMSGVTPQATGYPFLQQHGVILSGNTNQHRFFNPSIPFLNFTPNQPNRAVAANTTVTAATAPRAEIAAAAINPAPAPSAPTIAPLRPVSSTSLSEDQCTLLSLNMDQEYLSDYQCLVRKQIELFAATPEYVNESVQGRNRQICLEQIGIRCLHCGKLPPSNRAKGSVYFPSRLLGLYQTAQNMANAHLVKGCNEIPADIRRRLIELREAQNSKSFHGGGRRYWAQGLRAMGIIESPDRRLRIQEDSNR